MEKKLRCYFKQKFTFLNSVMLPYVQDYGMTVGKYLASLELPMNPLDLLGIYLTCLTFTFPIIIATENLEWQHNMTNRTASPIDHEMFFIFNGNTSFDSSSMCITVNMKINESFFQHISIIHCH